MEEPDAQLANQQIHKCTRACNITHKLDLSCSMAASTKSWTTECRGQVINEDAEVSVATILNGSFNVRSVRYANNATIAVPPMRSNLFDLAMILGDASFRRAPVSKHNQKVVIATIIPKLYYQADLVYLRRLRRKPLGHHTRAYSQLADRTRRRNCAKAAH